MDQRRKVILRQVFRPPYVYRWAVLVGSMSTAVALSASVITAHASGEAAAAARAQVSAPAVVAPPALARVVSSRLVTLTARPGRTVALTFDDGPHPQYTPRVLALLRAHGARATFCMIGEEAARHPDLVRDVVHAGMALCDHTMTHDAGLGDRDPVGLERGLGASGRALATLAGVPVRYFRAPEGHWTTLLQRTAARRGLWSLGWSVDSLDWTLPGVDRIVRDVQRQMHPGAVVLFHDGGGHREQTLAALARLLPWLEAQGYRFDLPA